MGCQTRGLAWVVVAAPDAPMTAVAPSDHADRDTWRRSAVLATCCLSVFMAGLDTTIANVRDRRQGGVRRGGERDLPDRYGAIMHGADGAGVIIECCGPGTAEYKYNGRPCSWTELCRGFDKPLADVVSDTGSASLTVQASRNWWPGC